MWTTSDAETDCCEHAGAGKASKKLRGASPKKQAEKAGIELFRDADCR